MRALRRRRTLKDLETDVTEERSRPPNERQVELAMFRLLLSSLNKRHAWDRIKCAIATGIPVFWILMLAVGPSLPPVATSAPPWLAAQVLPLLEDVPALWTIGISLAIAAFQWYNLVHYKRDVIPLVRDMYERARTRRDPGLLAVFKEALRFRTLRESFGAFLRNLFSASR